MRELLKEHRVRLDEVPIKIGRVIVTTKRYLALLRVAWERVRTKAGLHTSAQDCEQLAVFCDMLQSRS